jgi:hypothetical protein
MRTENTVQRDEADFFDSVQKVHVESVSGTIGCLNELGSPEIMLLAKRASDQVVNGYLLNLDDFFNENWTSPRLSLIRTWCLPKDPLALLKKHPSSPLVAVLDESGGFSIYHTTPAESMGLSNSVEMTIEARLPQGMTCDCWTWLPSHHNLLVLSDRKHAYIYTSKFVMMAMLPHSEGLTSLLAMPDWSHPGYCALIIGFNDLHDCSIWKLLIDESGNVDVSLVTTCPLDIGSIVFQPFSFNFKSIQSPSLFGDYNSTNNEVSFWHFSDLAKMDTSPLLSKTTSFKLTDIDRVLSIKPASFGKVAISHFTQQKYFVDIWDNEFNGLEMSKEWRISLNESPVALDWLTLFDGQHLLALATKRDIFIYGKGRSATLWNIIVKHPSFKDDIKAIGWLEKGNLLVSFTNGTTIISPWISSEGSSMI